MNSVLESFDRIRESINQRLHTPASRVLAALALLALVLTVVVGFVGRSAEFEAGDGPIAVECGSPFARDDLANLGLTPAGSDELVAANAISLCDRSILTARWTMLMMLIAAVGLGGAAVTRPKRATQFQGDPIV